VAGGCCGLDAVLYCVGVGSVTGIGLVSVVCVCFVFCVVCVMSHCVWWVFVILFVGIALLYFDLWVFYINFVVVLRWFCIFGVGCCV